jgi:tetratricopeptide (TPR) repeat protein
MCSWVKNYSKRELAVFIGILAMVVGVYLPSLQYAFYPNLDDGRLILNNPVVTNFPEHATQIFTEFVYGLYHPITTLSFVMDYQLFGTDPFGYRLHNLLLHLINCILVFLFVKNITQNKNISLFTSLLFGLHPMHVESVIWISERKDVLFTLFLLLSLITYQKNKISQRVYLKILVFVFFLLSLLSKATAAVLPILLVLLDYLTEKKFTWKYIWIKWPYFLTSLVFGMVNIKAQNSIDFIQPIAYNYTFLQLISLPVYAFVWYISQLFVPIGMAAKHLYPRVLENQIAVTYYLGWIGIILVAFVAYKFRKNKLFIAGILFYASSILLLVKIIPTGNDIVSERYSYVPYIGLGIAVGSIVIPWLEQKKDYFMISFFALLAMVWGVFTFQQSKHWENETTIWSRVIETEPELPLAYFERGKSYQFAKAFDKAISDYTRTIELSASFYEAYINRGLSNYLKKNNEQALADFSLAVKIDPENGLAYYHRGNLYLLLEQYNQAVSDFNLCRDLEFKQPELFYYKGLAEQKTGAIEESIQSLEHFLTLKPKHNQAAYALANILARTQKYDQAILYYNQVIEAEPAFANAYLNRGNAFLFLNEIEKACNDWAKADELGIEAAKEMLGKYCR